MGYPLLACIALLFSTVLTIYANTVNVRSAHSEAAAIAANMQLYRNYVISYAAANTTVTGTVADASMSLPTWFTKNGRILNYVQAGKGYVYMPSAPSDTAYQVVKSMNAAIITGINVNGILINPLSNTNTTIPIALPAAIPNNSVVIAQ